MFLLFEPHDLLFEPPLNTAEISGFPPNPTSNPSKPFKSTSFPRSMALLRHRGEMYKISYLWASISAYSSSESAVQRTTVVLLLAATPVVAIGARRSAGIYIDMIRLAIIVAFVTRPPRPPPRLLPRFLYPVPSSGSTGLLLVVVGPLDKRISHYEGSRRVVLSVRGRP
jgi:hypothetical protein